jgi:signal transduction histidine kinase
MDEESSENYRAVLQLPFDLVDESGIPLALYAADPLLQENGEVRAVVERIQARFSGRDWISPVEAYLIKGLAEKIASAQSNEVTRETAESCGRIAVEHIEKVEQALALQRDFADLDLLSDEDEPRGVSPVWIPYGQTRWLVSLAPSGQESETLLLAVGAKEALESATADQAFGAIHSGRLSFVSASNAEGETVGPSFPGLNLAVATIPDERLSEPSVLRYFYLITVILVLSVTFFGAYLLWRDVRREVEAAELRSQFVSSVSHELKTPLTAIQMFAETLRLGRTRNPSARREYLDTIVNEAQRLTRLLNNVLDFSRIEAGKRVYRPQPSSLQEVIQAAVRAIGYPLKQGGFELKVEIENSLPKIRVDRDGLEQAILNLLDNAMKYSGDSRQIDLTLKREDSHAVVQVADRGRGIPPEEQERIFEKFYRVSVGNGARIPGTGLGLSLVSHLVKTHEGRVEVESTPGKGSTFSIYLPLGEQ